MPAPASRICAWIARLAVLVLAVAFGLGGSMAGCTAEESAPETPEGMRVYVGTGSDDPEAGIYRFRFAPRTGALTPVGSVTPTMNPTYLTLSEEGRHLYSVNETADSAMVSAFAVDPDTGDLTRLNQVAARGGAPCYISMDATGRWVFVANYLGGNLAVFPVQDDGSLGAATQVVSHTGSGADPERQTAPHAHYVHVDPQNRYVLAADLGIDEIRVYPFDAARGRLDTAAVRRIETPPGTGPRHLAVHPNGEIVYMIGELSGTVTAYDYDAETGRMTPRQTVRTVPEDFDGAARSADIHVHPSGNVVYASNRGDANGIVHYRVDDTGTLTAAGRQRDQVEWPRHFAIAPGGEHLLVANRHADRITVYRIHPGTGALTVTGQTATVPAPTNITFAPTAPRPQTEP
jgi:6-phosphogluconolactonase